MDKLTRWFTQDVDEPIYIRHGGGLVFTGDAGAPVVGVHLVKNGAPAALPGSVSATVIRPDGTTVPIASGVVSGGDASVALTAACFSVPGPIGVAITLSGSGVTMTVLKAVFNVEPTATGTIVDPAGTVALTVADLVADIDAATASIPASYTDLMAAIAPTFSPSTAYTAGAYVWYEGNLYRFVVNHSGTWSGSGSGSDVTQVALANDLRQQIQAERQTMISIGTALAGVSSCNLFSVAGFVPDFYVNASGVETYGAGFMHTGIIPVTPSQTYQFSADAVNRGSGWTIRFHAYINGVWAEQIHSESVPGTGGPISCALSLGAGQNGIIVSFVAGALENSVLLGPEGETAIDRVARAEFPNYFKCTSITALPAGNLNDYYNVSGSWLLDSGRQYTNTPDGLTAGFLACYAAKNFTLQLFYPFTQNYIYKRRGNASGWNAWGKILADPADTLQPTGDGTNRTTDIEARLTAAKVCRLGPGVFYVQGVDMPDDSAIIGSGPDTKIILLGSDTTEGYAVKMGSRCSISHVSILGNAEDHTANSDRYDKSLAYVNRHGILWQGTVTPSTSGDTTRRANVTDCFIANFSGGGITLQNTGLNTISGINVSDVYIWHCYAGINVAYYSEFNRFSNVSVGFCHYGAINNGGNNVFANCNFSSNTEGMLIDNTNSGAPNNSHGSVTNCIFDHSDQNYGIGIHLIGVSFGEVFSNCQLFFSQIVVENCNGVVFSSLNAGTQENIVVKNSKCVIFANCVFRKLPYFVTIGNQKMIVRDCLAYGETTPADVVLSAVEVTAMPVNYTGAVGGTAVFTVTASNVESYQWQWRYADHSQGDWANTSAAGNQTNSISVEITTARLAYEYRCKMLDSSGNAAYTDTVRIISA